MADKYGSPRMNGVILAIVGAALVAIVIYVLASGHTKNPILFVGAAVVIVIIGVFVYMKRARSK